MPKWGTGIIWSVWISVSSKFDFFFYGNVRSCPWHGNSGVGLCFTNWARNRNDSRWKKSVNSSDRRLCCSFVQMAIDAGIVQHVGGRKSIHPSYWNRMGQPSHFWVVKPSILNPHIPCTFLIPSRSFFQTFRFPFLEQAVEWSLKGQGIEPQRSPNILLEETELTPITGETKVHSISCCCSTS